VFSCCIAQHFFSPEKAFERIENKPLGRLPNAAIFADNAFCLLVHHTVTAPELEAMLKNIQDVLTKLK